MSIYVMSDIHGHKKEFDRMLEKIEFSDEDELWILGDIIDRGYGSADMLDWAMDDAPDNVHFLLGNHEDMMCSALSEYREHGYFVYDEPWLRNGGDRTLSQYGISYEDDFGLRELARRAVPWIRSLPLHKKITIGEKNYMLVHAGFNPDWFEGRKKEDLTLRYCDGNVSYHANRDTIEIEDGFGEQYAQDLLWQRDGWLLDGLNDAPYDVISGHTYISPEKKDIIETVCDIEVVGGAGKIAHINEKKHDVDCGCAKATKGYESLPDRKYNLGCLRLDDMKEFYVKCVFSYDEELIDEDENDR